MKAYIYCTKAKPFLVEPNERLPILLPIGVQWELLGMST